MKRRRIQGVVRIVLRNGDSFNVEFTDYERSVKAAQVFSAFMREDDTMDHVLSITKKGDILTLTDDGTPAVEVAKIPHITVRSGMLCGIIHFDGEEWAACEGAYS